MKYPWMPMFWGDFLANTMDLSAQEAGAYLFLIAHAWEHGGKIPGDSNRLARIAHVRGEWWRRVWRVLEQFFEKHEEPTTSLTHHVTTCDITHVWYTHVRVIAELQRLGKKSNDSKARVQKQRESYAQLHRGNGEKSPVTTSISIKEERKSAALAARADRALAPRKQYLGISPDQGPDYRAPPRTRSDNVLQPLPEKPQSSLAARKRPSEKVQVSSELKAIVAGKQPTRSRKRKT